MQVSLLKINGFYYTDLKLDNFGVYITHDSVHVFLLDIGSICIDVCSHTLCGKSQEFTAIQRMTGPSSPVILQNMIIVMFLLLYGCVLQNDHGLFTMSCADPVNRSLAIQHLPDNRLAQLVYDMTQREPYDIELFHLPMQFIVHYITRIASSNFTFMFPQFDQMVRNIQDHSIDMRVPDHISFEDTAIGGDIEHVDLSTAKIVFLFPNFTGFLQGKQFPRYDYIFEPMFNETIPGISKIAEDGKKTFTDRKLPIYEVNAQVSRLVLQHILQLMKASAPAAAPATTPAVVPTAGPTTVSAATPIVMLTPAQKETARLARVQESAERARERADARSRDSRKFRADREAHDRAIKLARIVAAQQKPTLTGGYHKTIAENKCITILPAQFVYYQKN